MSGHGSNFAAVANDHNGWKAVISFSRPLSYESAMMRALHCMLLTMLAGCATPNTNAVPSMSVIAGVESGYLLLKNIELVGVTSTQTMNAQSRVVVRDVKCVPDGVGKAICQYQASRCLNGEADPDADGWCHRTSRFIRVASPEYPSHIAMIYKGWTVERAK